MSFGNPDGVPKSAPGYGTGQTPFAVSATGAASSMSATVAAVPGKTNYITGFDVMGLGATAAGAAAASLVNSLLSVTGVSWQVPIPAGATLALSPFSIRFSPPLPAASAGTAVSLSVASFGAGNTTAACAIYGYTE